VVQVVLPDGQLAFVLPLVSAPQAPPAQFASWPHAFVPLPQQHQQVSSAGWQLQPQHPVPGPIPPPRPPPRPPSKQRSALPAKRPLDAAANADIAQPCQNRIRMENGTAVQQAAVAPSNQAAALALRSRLRDSTAGPEGGRAATVAPCEEEPAATQPPVKADPAPAAGDPGPCPLPPSRAAAAAAQQTSRQQAPAAAQAACQGTAQQERAPDCITRMAAEGDDTEAVFLGTGAAEPSKYRGASAIHLRCRPNAGPASHARARVLLFLLMTSTKQPPAAQPSAASNCWVPVPVRIVPDHTKHCPHRLCSGGGLLLDAGEGCLAQLTRAYGAAGAAGQVAALAAVWLSHRHADHMLGLPALLATRLPSAPPLLVIGALTCYELAFGKKTIVLHSVSQGTSW
jgi:Beta-lactamase superfamily domain